MAPCFLLLDNIDIILGGVDDRKNSDYLDDTREDSCSPEIGSFASGKKRSKFSNRTSSVVFDRLLSALLVEIDGIGKSSTSRNDFMRASCIDQQDVINASNRSAPVIVIATATNPHLLDRLD
jgi:SpoVK/Ycf46/Vps4 family AAA+-type ATPase